MQPSQHSVEIDESLYSRQLYVMGREAQLRMASSSVLIAGLNGLGVEVAKNVILAGVKSVTLIDHKTTSWEDLSSQFYLSEKDIGLNRAEASVSKLAELNPYVHVSIAPSSSASSSLLSVVQNGRYNVVVMIDYPLSVQHEVAAYCHQHNIAVIIGDVRGVCGQIFCDFGENFVIYDKDGEPAANAMIAGITKDAKGLVTVLEETRHNLNTGDVVVFSDIVGMEELNGVQCRVDVKDPFSFEIDHDTSNYHAYERGGYMNQIKQPQTISFQSFQQSFSHPQEFIGDFNKLFHASILHYCFYTLHEYIQQFGHAPKPGNLPEAERFHQLLVQLNERAKNQANALTLSEEQLQDYAKMIQRFAMTCCGNLSPVCAQVGGVLGQEVLKACSGKFMPITQWFYYDAFEALPEPLLPEEEVSPVKCRYDGQIMVFGKTFQQRLAHLRMFLVGAGAIGCEMLKNWAMMGISCPVEDLPSAATATTPGKVIVTDMDQIEKSNLSRQFLFRNKDINQPKSTTSIQAVTGMNPAFQGVALEQKVATETEHLFNDDFYESIDMVCTALDNVEARLYIDQKCLFYKKPMLESGTLGAKGHTQIVVPHKTENYGATRDPPEKSIPVCTLKHFPNQIEHTLQWAREWFEETFKQAPDEVCQYLENPNFLSSLDAQPNTKLETIQRLVNSIQKERPLNLVDCVLWARRAFEDLFANRIKQLLHNFPLDRLTSSGTPFWSGSKKPPTPLVFDPRDPLHAEFVLSVANMRAMMYNLPLVMTAAEREHLLTVAADAVIEQFQPKGDVKIAASDEELKNDKQNASAQQLESAVDLDRLCQAMIQSLPTPDQLRSASSASSSSGTLQMQVIDFDKDIDSHMHVIASTSNLRARNYKIPEADLHTSRGIAGKITPAIATTTALVTGAICMELYKLLLEKDLQQFLNTFTNLAIPLFTSMEPEPPKAVKTRLRQQDWQWTPWDHLEIADQPEMTVEGFLAHFLQEYSVEVSMISSGVTILYSDYMDRKKQTERKGYTMKQLVEKVTKKTLPEDQRYLVFEIMASDSETGDDVELPHVRFRL